MITLNSVAKNISLSHSELYSQEYVDAIPRHVHTYNELSVSDHEDWFNSVIYHFEFSSVSQFSNFNAFYDVVVHLLETIDPQKLKFITDSIEEESDLLIWRESPAGISKLIFEDSGTIVYAFNGNDGSKIRGEFDSTVDFTKLLYRFLTK